jgi:uncharacterized repeat protein (TIGR04076 family)
MKRRTFIHSAAASACALGGVSALAAGQDQPGARKVSCKLTVLKKEFRKEYADKYRKGKGAVCNKFEEGQVFLTSSPWEPPAGFCAWAWGDIRTYIHDALSGQSGPIVACCTDGFRPVFFSIERVEA